MTGYYWIKFYHEVLDDAKVAVLPDRLWRRFFELCLLAGTFGRDGLLPNTQKLAWRLRMQTDDLSLDLTQLSAIGLIQQVSDGWIVKNFSKRQEAVPDKDRKAAQRNREQKEIYYGTDDVTSLSRNVTQINREDKIREDTDKTQSADAVPKNRIPTLRDAERAYMQVTGFASTPAGLLPQLEIILDLIQHYGWDETINRLTTAIDNWKTQKNKTNGQPYRLTNPAWIDLAITGECIGAPQVPKDSVELIMDKMRREQEQREKERNQ